MGLGYFKLDTDKPNLVGVTEAFEIKSGYRKLFDS